MSVRVNLLPGATREKARAARQRRHLAAAGLTVIIAIVGVHVWTLGRVDDARSERDDAQAHLLATQAEITAMADFAELDREHEQSMVLLTASMGREISFAGVLQDVAAVTPDTVALTTLELTRSEELAAVGADMRPTVARLTTTGESLQGTAPGVENFMLQLGLIGSLAETHLTNVSTTEESRDVPQFTIEADVTELAYTKRYLNGLPKGLK